MIAVVLVSVALAAAGFGGANAYDYIPSCYEPQTQLSCGAQAGLECYDAGGSGPDCSGYFCCTPPSTSQAGRKLAAYEYIPTCRDPQPQLSCGPVTGLECYDAGGSSSECSAYYCCGTSTAVTADTTEYPGQDYQALCFDNSGASYAPTCLSQATDTAPVKADGNACVQNGEKCYCC